jgi:hypothetical protein
MAQRRSTESKKLGSLRVVSRLRERRDMSLTPAAAEEGLAPATVLAYAGPAFRKEGGRWRVTEGDRIPRTMKVHTEGKTIWVTVRGSRKASELSAYHTAVREFRDTGDESALQTFEGRSVAGHPYETRPVVLEELARRGYLTTEHIYRISGG